MSDIQRYDLFDDDYRGVNEEKDKDGQWVKYTDHIKSIDDTFRFLVTERDMLIMRVKAHERMAAHGTNPKEYKTAFDMTLRYIIESKGETNETNQKNPPQATPREPQGTESHQEEENQG